MRDDETALLNPEDGRRLVELDRRADTLREILRANAGHPVDNVGPELARVTEEATEIREAAPGKIAEALGWVVVDQRSPFSLWKLAHGRKAPKGQTGEDQADAASKRPIMDRPTQYRVPVPAPAHDRFREVWHRPAGIAVQTLAPDDDVYRFVRFHGLDLARLPYSWSEPERRSAWLLVGPWGAASSDFLASSAHALQE